MKLMFRDVSAFIVEICGFKITKIKKKKAKKKTWKMLNFVHLFV
jgi:hypothetical protein